MTRAAQLIGCDRRTLARERIRCPGEYCPVQAEQHRGKMRSLLPAYKRQGALKLRLNQLLTRELSPEQAVGCMALEGHPTVSASTAYRHIYADAADGGTLHTHTRRGRHRSKKRPERPTIRGILRNRRPIGERPDIVDMLERAGDLEVDTIVDTPRKGALVTVVDRVSLHTWMVQAPDGSRRSGPVVSVLGSLLRAHRDRIHTITSDNGKEFVEHQHVAGALKADWFFADPYCTNQRAGRERERADTAVPSKRQRSSPGRTQGNPDNL